MSKNILAAFGLFAPIFALLFAAFRLDRPRAHGIAPWWVKVKESDE